MSTTLRGLTHLLKLTFDPHLIAVTAFTAPVYAVYIVPIEDININLAVELNQISNLQYLFSYRPY